MEKNKLFREKSMKRLSSPEQLNDYLRVTNPFTWMVLFSVVFLLAGLLAWSSFTVIQSYAYGTAQVSEGVLSITFDDLQAAEKVEEGMTVNVGDTQTVISSVGRNKSGKIIAVANANVPDGTYSVKVGYRQTKIIQMLFN